MNTPVRSFSGSNRTIFQPMSVGYLQFVRSPVFSKYAENNEQKSSNDWVDTTEFNGQRSDEWVGRSTFAINTRA